MIDNKIEELFNIIKESIEYKDYIEIKSKLEKDEYINNLIKEIKKLQQEATKLEYNEDIRYIEIDNKIQEKVDILNSNILYQEYLKKMKILNNILSKSSKIIENYVNDKI